MTTLIACSHGTRSLEGRATIAALVELVRSRVPGVRVEQAFVDVEEPAVREVVAAGGPAVIVPLLLSRGFHTGVDIARAARSRTGVTATAPLGPHDLLAEVLMDRVLATGPLRVGDHVVLAAAGSTDPDAVEDVEAMRTLLARVLPAPVTIGYAADASPRISDAVAAARSNGAERVIAASYVLAPGHFADVVAAAGADVTTDVLGADVRIARIVAERYAAASTLVRA